MIRNPTMAIVAKPNPTMAVGLIVSQDVLTVGHIPSLPVDGRKFDTGKYPELYAVLEADRTPNMVKPPMKHETAR